MGFGGIIAGAIGGAGQGMTTIGDNMHKDDQLQQARQAQIDLASITSNLAADKEKALLQYKQNLGIQDQQRTAGIIQQGAAAIADQRLAPKIAGIQDGATNPDYGPPATQDVVDGIVAKQKGKIASSYPVMAQAAAQAGLLSEAATLDKIGDSGVKTLAPYAQLRGSDGALIAENDAVQKQQDAMARDQLRADGRAAGKRADHFDEKQWDAAGKIDKSVVSIPDAMGGKDVESGDLRSAYMKTFNSAKTGGDMAPNEAAEYATTTVVRLKNAAAERVRQAQLKDPKSALTIDQAVRAIVKEADAYAPKVNNAPAGNASEAAMRKSATGDMGADPKAIQRELASARADLEKVTDEPSKQSLRDYIAGLEAKASGISSAQAETKPAQVQAAAAPTPAPAASALPEYDRLKNEAKALDSQISEMRRDYNLATSVRGGKGIDPEVPDRIKAKLSALIAQQKLLEDQSNDAYHAADRAIIGSRFLPSANLNQKYAQ